MSSPPHVLAVAVAIAVAAFSPSLGSTVAAATFSPSPSSDTLSLGSSLSGNQTLVSNGGVFQLGFFTPEGGTGTYLAIWYNQIPGPTIVWVANRQKPVVGSPAELRLSPGGQLQVLDGKNIVWCSAEAEGNVTAGGGARLLNSGDFVVTVKRRSSDDGRIIWQSFEHPTDTLLPGMRLGLSTSLTAWRSTADPAQGKLKFQLMQSSGIIQLELLDGTTRIYETSPWTGKVVPGGLFSKSREFEFHVISGTTKYIYFENSVRVPARLVLDSTVGVIKRMIWVNKKWIPFSYHPEDPCDNYALCGAYGYCDARETLLCKCVPGFKPRSPSNWNLRDSSNGCVRQNPLVCTGNRSTDGFQRFKGVKLPEAKLAKLYTGISLNQCRDICLRNCSCRAYSALRIGCTIWTGELLDMRLYNTEMEDQEVYIRVAHADASPTADPGKSTIGRAPQATHQSESHKKKTYIIVGSVLAGFSAISIICVLLHHYGLVSWKRGSEESNIESLKTGSQEADIGSQEADIESLSFMKKQGSSQPRWPVKYTFAELTQITRSFSVKLGEGGYGAVYRGHFPGGSNVPVAVKLLKNKKGSGKDFESEVTTISRASHYNIISLLGYCLEGSHRALIYEYMPNGSLDLYKCGSIFDSIETKQLHWHKLYEIIVGIARGIDYMYTGCRTQIVHFDIKPQNILLDQNLCPKISDFGLAKLCEKKEREIDISGARGTIGYMAPEVFSRQYGRPSSKSDIYSFGMVILEMVGARKMENVDTSGSQAFTDYLFDHLDEFCSKVTGEISNEATQLVKKMVIVALNCVQIYPAQRPPANKVLEMLQSKPFKLELPPKVGF